MTEPRHAIAGRLGGASGTVTFCLCGLGFFAIYPAGKVTRAVRLATQEAADQRWDEHWKQVRPARSRLVHPDPVEVVRDALRRAWPSWSTVGIDRQAHLAVNALRLAGILTDRPPDPGKETP